MLTESEKDLIGISEEFLDTYEVSSDISSIYRINALRIYDLLKLHYPARNHSSFSHITFKTTDRRYESKTRQLTEEEVEMALAIVKTSGFQEEEKNGEIIYTAEIVFHKDNENLLLKYEQFKDVNKSDLGFQYSPYNMDSEPEKEFFLQLLEAQTRIQMT